MSGGSFSHAYHRVDEFVYTLNIKLENPDGDWERFSPEVVAKLREILRMSEKTAALMKEVEWLYSSDTGEDSFLTSVKEIG